MKPKQQPQPPLPSQEEEEPYEEINNYYDNENYKGNSRGHRLYRVNKVAKGLLEDPNKGDKKTKKWANTRVTVHNLTPPMEAITITILQ